MLAPSKHFYEFGPFRLDLAERALLHNGQYVPLTPKALETLVVLVEHRGRILDKEDLLKLVWPDTIVEEVSLAKNVSTIRKALGETEAHRYIETVPKRGYRFIGEVREVECEEEGAAPPEKTSSGAVSRSVWARRWPWIAGALVSLAAAFLYWLTPLGPQTGLPGAPPRTIPLTSYPGHQTQVAFSPDGNQIAFVWDGPRGGESHIYVKLIGSEALLPLTKGPGTDSRPAWSPDGREIAFMRSSADSRAWYVTSALGGAERKLTDVFPYLDPGNGNSPYFSPDGRYLAIVDKASASEPSSIYFLGLPEGTRRRLTYPPAGSTGDYYPSFSPDGRMLAFARAVSFTATDLYVLKLSGGEPKRLTFDGLAIEGLTWTPDGRELVFASRRGGSTNSLWRISAKGGTPERVSTPGEDIVSPAVSHTGNRLAYSRALDDMNIWSVALDANGRAVSRTPLVASTFRDSDPDYSPDGRHIAFTSGRAGSFGIWVCDADGGNPRLLFDGGAYVTGSPRWSPDGKRIAFDSRAHDPKRAGSPSIWIISAEGGQPQRLTEPATSGVAPSWSRDGRWIYFASPCSGNMEIWKMPSQGGPAVQVTRKGGFEGFESADGRLLYYLKSRGIPGVWRVPVEGGEESAVTTRDQAGMWRCWRVTASRLYFATAAPPVGPRLEFMDLATGETHEIERLPRSPDVTIPSLAVSPDGRRLLYAQYDQSGSNIMMVERFR